MVKDYLPFARREMASVTAEKSSSLMLYLIDILAGMMRPRGSLDTKGVCGN